MYLHTYYIILYVSIFIQSGPSIQNPLYHPESSSLLRMDKRLRAGLQGIVKFEKFVYYMFGGTSSN